MSNKFHCGQEFFAEYPFVRAKYDDFSGGEPIQTESWRPGVNFESDGFAGHDACADANGKVAYTVIAVFKPGSYPERVFFVRNWVDPDGKRFGKGNLRMTTSQNFKALIRGYRHPYEMYEA